LHRFRELVLGLVNNFSWRVQERCCSENYFVILRELQESFLVDGMNRLLSDQSLGEEYRFGFSPRGLDNSNVLKKTRL